MSHAVVFTGAGASSPLGYPTVSEFFDPSEESHPWLGDCQPLLKEVVRWLRKDEETHRGSHYPDLEAILSLLDPIREFFRTPSGQFLSDHAPGFLGPRMQPFLHLVADRCFDLYGRTPDYGLVESIYVKLLDALDWRSRLVPLFTTNFDPVTDCIMEYAENFGVPVYDGFRFISGKWDPARYDPLRSGLAVHRLRGSLSWVREGGYVKNTRAYGQTRNRDHLVVYPGIGLDEGRESCFEYPHQALEQRLQAARDLIVIGYSFRDPRVNRIIKTSLARNSVLKLVVVDPHLPAGIENLSLGDGRLVHIDKKIEEAIADQSFKDLITFRERFRAGE